MAVRNPPAAGHTHALPEGTDDDDDDGHPEPIPHPRVNPSRKEARKKTCLTLYPQREGIRDRRSVPGPGTHALTHTHARTHSQAVPPAATPVKKGLGIPDFPPDDDSVPQ